MSIADEGRILYARRTDAWVLRFEGAIRYTGAHALDRFLDNLFAQQDPASICVDLSAATSIDSTGIGMLAKVANGLRQSGKGKPVLVSTNPEITELLVNLCLDEVCLIVTEGIDAPAAEAIPSTTPSEREVARTALEAHRLLSGLSDQNRETFASVVDALAGELGESTTESPPIAEEHPMNEPSPSPATRIDSLRAELAACILREQRACALIETAPDAMVVVDQTGHIVLVNAQAEKLFGYTRAEMLGQAIELLVPASARAGHRQKRDAFIAHPSVRPMGTGLDLAGRRKDGTEVAIEISLSPLNTDEGMLVSAAIRDITERREAQHALRQARNELEVRVQERTSELEQANRALQSEMADRNQAERALYQAQKMEAVGQLTGGVAHDFNNLLTVVMGNLQLLALHLKGDASADELIRGAIKAARRGADLNRTLLAFSRKQRLAPVPVDLNEMIAGMTGMLRRTLGEHVHVVVTEARGLPRATADAAQLEAALLNLAVNARDAMEEGGTLTIETGSAELDEHYALLEGDVEPGRYVMLAVSDTGTGMPPDVAARAFEPFFTTKETGKGSGLGLAMVYGFVKQSGGHIKIYSEQGIGTTVKLFLPETPRSDEAPAPVNSEQSAQPTGRETILVVEDEEDVRLLACRVLSGLGYRILQASQGTAALTILDQEPEISLLFTDVVLPGGMNGPEIARHAQARRPDLKVLFTSGYTGNAVQQLEALKADVRLITKPYAIDDLAHAVRAALDG